MSSILLIHGYGTGLTVPFLHPALGSTRGFRAFNAMIRAGKASVFYWGLEGQVRFTQFLNPFFILKYYRQEQRLAQDPGTHARLQKQLDHDQPQVIVCHSMGSVLLNAYLKTHNLPSSVRAIVFVQSDLSINDSIPSPIPVYNLYCPWDPTLLVSSLFNRSRRAGLMKIKYPNVQNMLFPLIRPFNLHTSSIRNPKLRKWILSLMENEIY